MNNKVLIGLSGGIDSSASALMLKEKGFEVIAASIRFWETDRPGFSSNAHLESARRFCKHTGIEHIEIDAVEQFKKIVLTYFLDGYIRGITPFPCAKCNPLVKWKILHDTANNLNICHIASGHYVGKVKKNHHYYISRGIDNDKDQSFFLWGLTQNILNKVIFPLENYHKSDVKKYLNLHGFESLTDKKESTGVCFADSGNYQSILEEHMNSEGIKSVPGNFIDENGKILGKHRGITYYTIGQRRGLNINMNKPLYVCRKNIETNEIVLSGKKSLYRNSFEIEHYIIHNQEDFDEEVVVKIRYRKQAHQCRVKFLSSVKAMVILDEELDSIASGQTAVFYKDGLVLGGGFIV